MTLKKPMTGAWRILSGSFRNGEHGGKERCLKLFFRIYPIRVIFKNDQKCNPAGKNQFK
jgi:hypothetical protein